MPPPRVRSAEQSDPSRGKPSPVQNASQIASKIEEFFARHPEAAVLDDGKVAFDLRTAKYTLSTEHQCCTLHLWSEERNLVRQVVAAAQRGGSLRLATQRFGQPQTKLLELVSSAERKTPTTRDSARSRYVHLLERVLQRSFPDWKPDGFRTAMDLERSFGPGYARGSLLRGNQAWAVIGVNENESAAIIDGVLTLGILWLHHGREQAGGRRLYQGLKVVVPRGTAMLTLSRMAWLNNAAAQWELYEPDQSTEDLTQRDAEDHGNLRTRLIHHADQQAAAERFANAVEQVMAIVPANDAGKVEQRLRNTAELAFLLHGMEFARARIGLASDSFSRTLEITVGAGARETTLTANNREQLAARIAELFRRRRAPAPAEAGQRLPPRSPMLEDWNARRIGQATTAPAHSRMQLRGRRSAGALNPQQDPLYRAAPELWLESVLRQDLTRLTRSLGPGLDFVEQRGTEEFANEPQPDNIGNRADPQPLREADLWPSSSTGSGFAQRGNGAPEQPRVIPRLDPRHVYSQVPAIAGASDRGLLDLLGVTADGRLAVIELKTGDDLHFALQGLDYWIRVRHHHLQAADSATGMGEFQRHGYFRGVELSPLPPRLYLVAPALHIHPATETILRYFSPRVEWNLLALDERWRQQIRVVWRRQGGL